ncbi:unnamed protein product [Caenorhabditis auriculariae]|uniref:Uncharacterized protein n=1 Tax=Caenorhabditis auriculariae TaxID=2777116 RepID=A0A8S1HQ82_9PELO|nr:unnamed protein product [Caenorhabditis auriculariae]
MWQYDDVDLLTTTINPNPNASIDRVIFQIQRLSGQINDLGGNGKVMVNKIEDRGEMTWNVMSTAFQNGTVQNVERILEIARQKTHDWPLVPLIVLAICGAVLVVITLVFLCAKLGERITEYRYQKRLSADSDIENI